MDPLSFERIKVDDNNPFSNTYGTCWFKHQETIGFAAAILRIDFLSILIACVQVYRAREIGDEFSESQWVAITIFERFTVRSISHGRLATTECEGRVQDLELQQ